MLRIAIQSKGRLHDDTVALLAEADIKITESKRTLLTKAKGYPLESLFLRDDDIPQTVFDGIADLGVVGLNELKEKGYDVDIVRSLGFGGCRLSLAIPKGEDYTDVSWFEGKKIATSYPKILQQFLEEKGIHASIHVITGSVEISTSIGIADAIFDIVRSGSTLVSNNLKEVEVVLHSEAVLIGNKSLSEEKKALLDGLLFRLEAVKQSEGKKYVLLNAPNESIEAITKILPGMKSPTVMPLAEAGWSSIHTVLDGDRFWEIVAQLRAVGAQGILVIPIEKMIL